MSDKLVQQAPRHRSVLLHAISSFPSLFLPLLLVQPLHHPLLLRRLQPLRSSPRVPTLQVRNETCGCTRVYYTAMYRRTTLLVRVYRLGFTRRGRETAGVFTISLETRRERNLEKGTFQITGKLLIPLSRASFRISCLLEIGGGAVKDLVVFDKYLQQRVSDILGFI